MSGEEAPEAARRGLFRTVAFVPPRWELRCEAPDAGYPLWDPLPWPPEPWRWRAGFPFEAVGAYLLALGERQRKFELDVLERLHHLERVVRDIDQRTAGAIAAR